MVIGWVCSRDLFETSWEGLHEVLPTAIAVSGPEYKVETLYSGTKVGVYILGTQCLNTA